MSTGDLKCTVCGGCAANCRHMEPPVGAEFFSSPSDMTQTPRYGGPCLNTDRELWREREGDYYADSIHVTEGGGIGMNCGGYVIVQPIRKWHEASRDLAAMIERADRWDRLFKKHSPALYAALAQPQETGA